MKATALRVLIADDEEMIRSVLRRLLERKPGVEVVGEARDGEEVLRLFRELSPQLVILDVDMPKINGVECAYQIQDLNPRCFLVFATAHEQYRADAFQVYAFDYWVKPFSMSRVDETLNRILTCAAEREAQKDIILPEKESFPAQELLMIKHKDGVSFLRVEDIYLVSREERQTVVYATGERRLVCSESLNDMEARLQKQGFMRSHKSYIISLRHLSELGPYGRWTYIVRFRGQKQDALITSDKLEELQKRLA